MQGSTGCYQFDDLDAPFPWIDLTRGGQTSAASRDEPHQLLDGQHDDAEHQMRKHLGGAAHAHEVAADSDADASIYPLPDEKSDALLLFCKWLWMRWRRLSNPC